MQYLIEKRLSVLKMNEPCGLTDRQDLPIMHSF